MNRLAAGMIVLGIVLRAAPAAAQLSDSDRAVVEAYRAAMDSAASEASPHGVEAAFAAFGALRDTLMQVRGADLTVLESLPEKDYLRLAAEVPGAILEREVFVGVVPDPDTFLALATAHGDSTDTAFFAAYKATYPEGVWPVYLEPQTDEGGCTRFGSLSLVETLQHWTGFQRRNPGRYRDPVAAEVQRASAQLTQSTCACGDLDGVERELQEFCRRFPGSPFLAEVRWRLDAVEAGRSNIQPHCGPG